MFPVSIILTKGLIDMSTQQIDINETILDSENPDKIKQTALRFKASFIRCLLNQDDKKQIAQLNATTSDIAPDQVAEFRKEVRTQLGDFFILDKDFKHAFNILANYESNDRAHINSYMRAFYCISSSDSLVKNKFHHQMQDYYRLVLNTTILKSEHEKLKRNNHFETASDAKSINAFLQNGVTAYGSFLHKGLCDNEPLMDASYQAHSALDRSSIKKTSGFAKAVMYLIDAIASILSVKKPILNSFGNRHNDEAHAHIAQVARKFNCPSPGNLR